jgi:hypothetical protein
MSIVETKATLSIIELVQNSSPDSCCYKFSLHSNQLVWSLTRQIFQVLPKIFDFILIDVANIGHKICNFAFAIRHLFVDIMIGQDFVDLSQYAWHVIVYENDLHKPLVLSKFIHVARSLGHVPLRRQSSFLDSLPAYLLHPK